MRGAFLYAVVLAKLVPVENKTCKVDNDCTRRVNVGHEGVDNDKRITQLGAGAAKIAQLPSTLAVEYCFEGKCYAQDPKVPVLCQRSSGCSCGSSWCSFHQYCDWRRTPTCFKSMQCRVEVLRLHDLPETGSFIETPAKPYVFINMLDRANTGYGYVKTKTMPPRPSVNFTRKDNSFGNWLILGGSFVQLRVMDEGTIRKDSEIGHVEVEPVFGSGEYTKHLVHGGEEIDTTIAFSTVCKKTYDVCNGHVCPAGKARFNDPSCAVDEDFSACTVQNCCAQLDLNVYAKEYRSLVQLSSVPYDERLGAVFDIVLLSTRDNSTVSETVKGVAPRHMSDPMHAIQGLAYAKVIVPMLKTPDREVLVQVERRFRRRGTLKKEMFVDAKPCKPMKLPQSGHMLGILVSEAKVNKKASMSSSASTAVKLIFGKRKCVIRFYGGVHIRIETREMPCDDYRLQVDSLLDEIHGDSGFDHFLFELVESGEVIGRTRVHTVYEVFQDVRAKEEMFRCDKMLEYFEIQGSSEPNQDIPLEDRWCLRSKTFFQGEVVLYPADVEKYLYHDVFASASTARKGAIKYEEVDSDELMKKWQGRFPGPNIDVQNVALDFKTADEYHTWVTRNLKDRRIKRVGSLWIAGSLTRVNPPRTEMNREQREAASSMLSVYSGLRSDTRAAIEGFDYDQETDEEKSQVPTSGRKLEEETDLLPEGSLDPGKMEAFFEEFQEDKSPQSTNDKYKSIKAKISAFMLPRFKRKWSMIGSALISALVVGISIMIPIGTACSLTGLATALVAGTRSGISKYQELKLQQKKAVRTLENTPLALLDVVTSVYEYIEYIMVHDGFVDIGEHGLVQMYMKKDKEKSVSHKIKDGMLHYTMAWDIFKKPIVPITSMQIKDQVLAMTLTKEEIVKLQEALKLLMSLKDTSFSPEEVNAMGILGYLNNNFKAKLRYLAEHVDGSNLESVFGAVSKVGFSAALGVENWSAKKATSQPSEKVDETTPAEDIAKLFGTFGMDTQEEWVANRTVEVNSVLNLGSSIYGFITTTADEKSHATMTLFRDSLRLKIIRLNNYLRFFMKSFEDYAVPGSLPPETASYNLYTRLVDMYNKRMGSRGKIVLRLEKKLLNLLDMVSSREQRLDFTTAAKLFPFFNQLGQDVRKVIDQLPEAQKMIFNSVLSLSQGDRRTLKQKLFLQELTGDPSLISALAKVANSTRLLSSGALQNLIDELDESQDSKDFITRLSGLNATHMPKNVVQSLNRTFSSDDGDSLFEDHKDLLVAAVTSPEILFVAKTQSLDSKDMQRVEKVLSKYPKLVKCLPSVDEAINALTSEKSKSLIRGALLALHFYDADVTANMLAALKTTADTIDTMAPAMNVALEVIRALPLKERNALTDAFTKAHALTEMIPAVHKVLTSVMNLQDVLILRPSVTKDDEASEVVLMMNRIKSLSSELQSILQAINESDLLTKTIELIM